MSFQHNYNIILAPRPSHNISSRNSKQRHHVKSTREQAKNKIIRSLKTAANIAQDTISSRMADLEADFKREMKKTKGEQRTLSQTNTMAFRELRARMMDQEIAHKEEMKAKINQELRLRDLIASTDIFASRVTDLERSTLARFQTLRVDLSATFRVLDHHICELEAEIAEQRAEQSDLRRILESLPKQSEDVELVSEGKDSGVAVQVVAGLSLEE